MKKIVGSIMVIILTLALVGCYDNSNQIDRDKIDTNVPTQNSNILKDKKYTKDNALAAFKADDDFNNYEIVECVLKDDDKVPILKAVISFYDKQKNNSNNLAFILENSVQKICFAENEVEGVKTFEIADGSHLSYIRNGTVTTSVRKIETGEILDFKVIFSYEESTAKINFQVISEKRTI